jgi:hypothetical protein
MSIPIYANLKMILIDYEVSMISFLLMFNLSAIFKFYIRQIKYFTKA